MYNRLKELLEQELLEFDPRQESRNLSSRLHKFSKARSKGGPKAGSRVLSKERGKGRVVVSSDQAVGASAAATAEDARNKLQRFAPKRTKQIQKVSDRALARGGKGTKGAGPKRKLPK